MTSTVDEACSDQGLFSEPLVNAPRRLSKRVMVIGALVALGLVLAGSAVVLHNKPHSQAPSNAAEVVGLPAAGCQATAWCKSGCSAVSMKNPKDQKGPYLENGGAWSNTATCLDVVQLSPGCNMEVATGPNGGGKRYTFHAWQLNGDRKTCLKGDGKPGYDKVQSIRLFKVPVCSDVAGGMSSTYPCICGSTTAATAECTSTHPLCTASDNKDGVCKAFHWTCQIGKDAGVSTAVVNNAGKKGTINWDDCENFGYASRSACQARCQSVSSCQLAMYDPAQSRCGSSGVCVMRDGSSKTLTAWSGDSCEKPQACMAFAGTYCKNGDCSSGALRTITHTKNGCQGALGDAEVIMSGNSITVTRDGNVGTMSGDTITWANGATYTKALCATAGSSNPCVFPFTYQGKKYNTCTSDVGKTWCATETTAGGLYVPGKWAVCSAACSGIVATTPVAASALR